MSRFRDLLYFCLGVAAVAVCLFTVPIQASAATCSIVSPTVITQAYVTSNDCSAIDIQGNVSTTWIGTVDLVGDGTVTIKSGYTMTAGLSSQIVLGSSDDLVVEGTGSITHVAEDPFGIQISARNVTVSGSINANAKGCAAGADGGSVANQSGSGPDTVTGVCAKQTSGYGTLTDGGGSHGGKSVSAYFGSTPQPIYGDQAAPVLLGSGGGGGPNGGEIGGAGGGRIQLFASGILSVSGTVTANGASRAGGGARGGGGSGGSVYLKAGTLTGLGSVAADGGQGDNASSGGAGGRVALYYGALGTFSVSNASAAGGLGGASFVAAGTAETGTVYALDRYADDGGGTLQIKDGFDLRSDKDYVRDGFTVTAGTRLACSTLSSGDITIDATTLSFGWFSWTCGTQVANVTVSSTNSFTFTSSTLTFTTVSTTRLYSSGSINFTTTTLNMANIYQITGPTSASVVFGQSASLNMVNSTISANVSSTLASLSIDSLSSVASSNKGCAAGLDSSAPSAALRDGFGPDLATGLCTNRTSGYGKMYDGGAAYGGAGGRGHFSNTPQTTTYGSNTWPAFLGSGGGGGENADEKGGRGGGIVSFEVVGTATVNGTLLANGETYPGSSRSGGGSGGSVFLKAGNVLGSGIMRALGGNGLILSGGGGGGRIAVWYGGGSVAGLTMAVTGGERGSNTGDHVAGSDGTTYTLQTNQAPDAPSALGPAGLTNGSTTGTNTPTFNFTLTDPDGSDTDAFQIQIDDSADFGSLVVDYTSALGAQGERSFQVGQAAGTGSYAVGSSGQALADGTYFWRVKTVDAAASESAYTTANSGSAAFIVDTDVRTIEFLSASGAAIESVTATSIKIVLNTVNFQDVTVAYAVTGGTATGGGEDYALASGTATIAAGQTSTTISLATVNDQIDEPNETIIVTLSSPSAAVLGAETAYTYTILDNDVAGVTVTESAGSSNVAEGGATDTFTISLDTPPTLPVLIAFATTTYGVTLSTSTVAFTSANWNVPVTVTVTGTDDAVDESTHTGSITSTISTPSGSVYGYSGTPPVIADITVSITDNDTAGVRLSVAELSVAEGGQVESYQVYLSTAPTTTVTVTAVPDDDQVIVTPAFLTFTPVNWNVPQLFQVGTVNDTVYEVTRGSRIVHRASSEGLVYNAELVIGMIEVETLDNDTAGGGGVGAGLAIPLPVVPVTPVPLEDSTGPVLPPLESSSGEVSPTPQTYQVIDKDVAAYRVVLPATDRERLADFVENGISEQTIALGSGERTALLRDLLETTGKVVSNTDLIRTANGQIPLTRNLSKEQALQPRALTTFRRIYGHAPNFKDAEENLAWNTLMYRIRFPRDLAVERQGIQEFMKLFGRTPSDPFQWATVRVLGYID